MFDYTPRPSTRSRVCRLLPAVALVAAAFGMSQAADAAPIEVENSALTDNTEVNGASLTVSSFGLGAGNALVVVVNSETGGGTGVPSYSVTYGGSAITENVFASQGAQAAGVFYAINPTTTTGDVVVTFTNSSRAAVSVLSLSNVQGVGDSDTATATNGGASGSPTFSITYDGAEDGFVVAGFVDNGSNNGDTPTITGTNLTSLLQSHGNDTFDGSAGIIQRSGAIAADGSYTADFKASRDGSSSSRNAAALVAFTAVPEPASLALVGLGGLMMIGRARKA